MVIQGRHQQQEKGKISLSGSRAYNNFIESIRSEYSRRLYTRILRAYMRHYGYTDCDSLIQGKKEPKQIESEIIAYLIKKRQLPSSLVYSTLSTIKACLVSFFSMNDVLLNSKKIGRYLGSSRKRILTELIQSKRYPIY